MTAATVPGLDTAPTKHQGLLAWVAAIGCREGLSSSALVGHTLGRRFAVLPVALNVLQLLGWTAFELVVMRDGTAAHRLVGDAGHRREQDRHIQRDAADRKYLRL